MGFYNIITALSPYIILFLTFVIQVYFKRKDEVPIIDCNIKNSEAWNDQSVVLVLNNISQYNALDFKISPEFKPYLNGTVRIAKNVLLAGDTASYEITNPQEFDFKLKFKDQHKRNHEIFCHVTSSEQGHIMSDLNCIIDYRIIK